MRYVYGLNLSQILNELINVPVCIVNLVKIKDLAYFMRT